MKASPAPVARPYNPTRMRLALFYRAWIRGIFRPAWRTLDTLSVCIGVALPIIAHFVPSLESAMHDLVWQVFLYGLVVLVLTRLFATPFLMHNDYAGAAAKTEADLRSRIRSLESETKRPHVEIDIHEAFIRPSIGRADCFLHVSLHNHTADLDTTINGCKLCLHIGERQYCSQQLKDDVWANYVADCVDDYEDPERLIEVKTTPLNDLAQDITAQHPLRRGIKVPGWLRFEVTPVPHWPESKRPVGAYQDFNHETGEVEWFVDFDIEYQTTNIKFIELSVQDAFGYWHSQAKKVPFASPMRRIKLA